MKTTFTLFLLLCDLWPLSLIGQIGVADPVTGNAAIEFYGTVVDQNGKPLSDAKVHLKVFSEYLVPPSQLGDKYDKTLLATDANGHFSLNNAQGHSVEIESIEKEGYKLSDKATHLYPYSWSANIFHPDPDNPVIFKMWKKSGAEPLVNSVWNGNISVDGTTNRFDLLRGHRNGEGGLEIICTRTPVDRIPREGKKFDYFFEIAVRGGGIQPTRDEFTYLAPTGDYAPKFIERKKNGERGWRGRFIQEFYFKTADGRYGRISVDWYASQTNPTHLDWNCSINPSGSRNLER